MSLGRYRVIDRVLSKNQILALKISVLENIKRQIEKRGGGLVVLLTLGENCMVVGYMALSVDVRRHLLKAVVLHRL